MGLRQYVGKTSLDKESGFLPEVWQLGIFIPACPAIVSVMGLDSIDHGESKGASRVDDVVCYWNSLLLEIWRGFAESAATCGLHAWSGVGQHANQPGLGAWNSISDRDGVCVFAYAWHEERQSVHS